MTSSDICAALRDKYKQPEWALFFEVANGTGGYARRHADALAMNMYPSRGLSILGFEIKVSRHDLKRELDNPDKAEEVAKYCDEWWLAVPKGLIKDGDNIPVPWGVMECENGKFSVLKKAQWLEAKQVTKQFLAAVVRSAGKVDEGTIAKAKNEAWREAYEHKQEQIQREVENRTRAFTEIKKQIEEIKQLTGEDLSCYKDIPKLAERILLAKKAQELEGFINKRFGGLLGIREDMQRFLNETEPYLSINKDLGR